MNGARIRSNSLSGTRPASTSASVPRLSAPKSARTRTSPGLGADSLSSRISARPGATYQSACAISAVHVGRHDIGSLLDYWIHLLCYIIKFARSLRD